jgi:hypothetical protein
MIVSCSKIETVTLKKSAFADVLIPVHRRNDVLPGHPEWLAPGRQRQRAGGGVAQIVVLSVATR